MRPKNLLKTKLKETNFSNPQLAIFALVFALIGGYLLISSFASGPVTFGISTPGNTFDALDANQKQVCPYQAPQNGKITKITAYISGAGATTGNQQAKAVIYADNAGAPGALLGVSTEVTVNAGQALGWVDFNFTNPVSIAAGTVWLGLFGNTTAHLIFINANSLSHNNLVYNQDPYSTGPSNPFGGNQNTNGYQYVLYATYATPSNFSLGDLNADGLVNVTDLSILLSNFGTTSSTADINADGSVNVFDLSILLTNFGANFNQSPTVTISASPTSIVSGGSSTITWTSTNATSCTASGAWSGSKATSGSQSVSPTTTSTYNLSCSGAGGSVSNSTTVIIANPSASIYWGAYVEGPQTYGYLYGTVPGSLGWETQPWCDPGYQCAGPKFASNAGKQPSIEKWGMAWDVSFDGGVASQVVARGDIPSIDYSNDRDNACDADVAAGVYDNSNVIPIAKAIATWGHPIIMTFDVEMNGGWYHYAPGHTCTSSTGAILTNTSTDFINMWRHVHDVYQQQGATNVSWAWVPNVDVDSTLTPMASVYPGDAYVDWTGLNGYNWGTSQGDIWRSFDNVFNRSYNTILQIAPSKPMLIGEFASDEVGGSKAAWITDALSTQLPQNYPQIKAIMWFNWHIFEKNTYWNWEMESSSSSQAAFANSIASSYYMPGGNLEKSWPLGSKVPVP